MAKPSFARSWRGKSVSGPATSGKPRSGEPDAINYSWDKTPESNQLPPLPPRKAGDDGRLAKNLARWLDGDDGLPVWSDGPILSDALGCDGEPLDMEGLAKADGGRVTPSEIAVVKCVLESCAAELDGAWARH